MTDDMIFLGHKLDSDLEIYFDDLHDYMLDICENWSVYPSDLIGSGKKGNIPLARAAFWFCCRLRLGFSFPMCGRVLRKHHTTVILSLRRLQRMYPGLEWDKMGEASVKARRIAVAWKMKLALDREPSIGRNTDAQTA